MNEHAHLVDQTGAQERPDERTARVHPNDLDAMVRAKLRQRRPVVDVLFAGDDRLDSQSGKLGQVGGRCTL